MSRGPHIASVAPELVSSILQRLLKPRPALVTSCCRPSKHHVVLQACSRDPKPVSSWILDRVRSKPNTTMTCIARDPCHPPRVVELAVHTAVLSCLILYRSAPCVRRESLPPSQLRSNWIHMLQSACQVESKNEIVGVEQVRLVNLFRAEELHLAVYIPTPDNTLSGPR